MKSIPTTLTLILLLQSCITIKVYQSEAEEKKQLAPKKEIKAMLPMGKTIHLDGAQHELMFFGEDNNHFEVFDDDSADSLKIKSIQIFSTKETDSTAAQWIPKGSKAKVMVFRTDTGDTNKDPLFIIDGIEVEGKVSLEEMNPNKIATINVLKGASAVKKYGDKAKNGVVEITTKKD